MDCYNVRLQNDTNIPNNYTTTFLTKDGHEIDAKVIASVTQYDGRPAVMARITPIPEITVPIAN